MEASFKKSYASLGADRLVLLWLGVWWIANLVQAGFTELANDEAYYHMFAERLAWGYFDHPPVTALLVWAGERLFGGELGVRFFFTVLQPLYLWILWRLIRPADAGRRDAALFVVADALGCRCGSCFHVIWNQEREAAGLDQKMSEDTSASVKVAVEGLKRLIEADRKNGR